MAPTGLAVAALLLALAAEAELADAHVGGSVGSTQDKPLLPLPGVLKAAMIEGSTGLLGQARGKSVATIQQVEVIYGGGPLYSVVQAFNLDCLGRCMDLGDPCAYAFPVYMGALATLGVVTLCAMHSLSRFCKGIKMALKQQQADEEAQQGVGLTCPTTGHGLVRFRPRGGRAKCSRCGITVEVVTGNKESHYGLCATCVTTLQTEKLSEELTEQRTTVEFILTLDLLQENISTLSKYFEDKFHVQAQAKGIPRELWPHIWGNLEITNASGVTIAQELWASNFAPENFPLRLKYSLHPKSSHFTRLNPVALGKELFRISSVREAEKKRLPLEVEGPAM